MQNPLGFLATQEGPLAVVLLLKVLYLFFKHQIFPDSGPNVRKCVPAKDLISCYGQAQTALLPYDFFLLRVLGSDSRWHHNDLGILFFELWQKPCNSYGEKLSVFFWFWGLLGLQPKVLVDQGQRSNKKCQREQLQTSIWTSQESHSTGAPVRSRESGSFSKSTVSRALLSLLTLTWKLDAPVQITPMELLTAIISTFNHFLDFRPCWILLGSSCQYEIHLLLLEDREAQISFFQQDLGECLFAVGLRDAFS